MKYVTYRQLTEQAMHHYKHCGITAEVQTILSQLFNQNKYHGDIPDIPQNNAWSSLPDETFFDLLNRLPANHFISVLLSVPDQYSLFTYSYSEVIHQQLTDIFAIKYIPYIAEKIHTRLFFEIIYVMQGNCTVIFNNETRALETGDLCIVPPNSSHDLSFNEDSIIVGILLRERAFNDTFFKLLNEEVFLSSFFNNMFCASPKVSNYMYFATHDARHIRQMIKDIFMECYSDDTYANACSISRALLLFGTLLKTCSHTIEFCSSQKNIHVNFIQLVKFIQENYAVLSLETLAEEFHYNSSYLSRMIKKNTGRTLVDILTEIKIQKACELLTCTDYKIEKIATLIGYSSADHFSRLFKTVRQISPKEYRMRTRQLQSLPV